MSGEFTGKAVPMVKVPRPSAYTPDGDSEIRDSILAALDSVSEDMRTGLALAFAVRSLDAFGSTALTPSMKRLASGTADAVRDLVPADVREIMENAKRDAAKKGRPMSDRYVSPYPASICLNYRRRIDGDAQEDRLHIFSDPNGVITRCDPRACRECYREKNWTKGQTHG